MADRRTIKDILAQMQLLDGETAKQPNKDQLGRLLVKFLRRN
jgi:hypothetical protein